MTQQAVFIQLTLPKWTCASRWGPAKLSQWVVFIDELLTRPYVGPPVAEADQSSAQSWFSDFILLATSVAGTPSEGRFARQYGHVHLLLFFILVSMQDQQNTWPQRVRTGWCSTSRHTEQSKEVMGSSGSPLRSRVRGMLEAGADLDVSFLSKGS